MVLARDSLAVRPSRASRVGQTPAHAGRLRNEPATPSRPTLSSSAINRPSARVSRPKACEDHILRRHQQRATVLQWATDPRYPTQMDIPYERTQRARLLIHEVPRPVLTPLLEAIGDEEDESMAD